MQERADPLAEVHPLDHLQSVSTYPLCGYRGAGRVSFVEDLPTARIVLVLPLIPAPFVLNQTPGIATD